jgi:drug/metabolite transporter (DMT)-like permease
MIALLLSFFTCLGWGIADFIGGLKSRSLPPLAVMIIANPFGILIIGIIVLWRGKPIQNDPTIIWAFFAGLIGVITLYLLYKGFSVGSIAIVAPISGTGVILPVAVGLIRGETPSIFQLIGILAAVIGTFLAVREKKKKEISNRLVSGIYYAIASAFGVGFYFIFMDAASEIDPYWASLVMRISYGLILLPIVIFTRTSLRGSRSHIFPIAAMGMIDSLAGFSFAVASTIGMLSIVSVISAIYPGVTVLLSVFILKEKIQNSQKLGILMIIFGIALISVG